MNAIANHFYEVIVMDLPVINFENGSRIEPINYGTRTHYLSHAATPTGSDIDYTQTIPDIDMIDLAWVEIKHRIAECDTWRSPPAISTDTYNTSYRNIDLFKKEYEEIQEMRILFVRPEVYDAVCEWYEGLNNVQKHRKATAIYKSISEFREQFDKDKFGVRYTTFYFDNMLAPTEIYESFKEFVRLYGEADARYISEALKMRTIGVDELMWRNNFDYFKVTSIDPDCIEDTIKQAAIEQTECYCRSLL